MKTKKLLRVTCDTKLLLPYEELSGIQGALKTLSNEDFEELKKSFLEEGINFAFHIWRDKKEKKWCIIDGVARHAVICYLIQKEGYSPVKLPCVEIEAKSLKDAKRKVLYASSSYHKMTKQGLYDFMTDSGLALEAMKRFQLPIDMPQFRMEFFAPTVEPADVPKIDHKSEWKGMPEFVQEDKTSFRQLIVHFKIQKDLDKFSKLIGQKITDKTRSIWFPKAEIETLMDKRYTSES